MTETATVQRGEPSGSPQFRQATVNRDLKEREAAVKKLGVKETKERITMANGKTVEVVRRFAADGTKLAKFTRFVTQK